MARLSLCMIARNEEQMLPGCLESVKGVVDEIVLVDTGSTDRTMEIARAAGAKVIELPWADDFAAPRNASIASATGDWILVLDADERLAPGAGQVLRKGLWRVRFDVGFLPLHNAVRLDADPVKVVQGLEREGPPGHLPRLLRNTDGLAYTGVVHESVDNWLLRRGGKIGRIAADIVHLGHVAALRKERGKLNRNVSLLRRRCELEPNDVGPVGYLAGELMQAGDDKGAQEVADAGWLLVDRQALSRSIHRLATIRAILALRVGDAAKALESVNTAEHRGGPHLDLHFLRGCALDLQAYGEPAGGERRIALSREAAGCYRSAIAARNPPPIELISEGADSHVAHSRLGDALLICGEPREALAAFEAALSSVPGFRKALLGRAEARLELADAPSALKLVESLLDTRPDAWVLAAAAALAVGSPADARLLLSRADERLSTGFESAHRRDRHASLHRALDTPKPVTAVRPGIPGARRFAVTVVSPPGYVHSEAFREVAEALHHGLLALGHDSVLGTDTRLSDRQHVVLGANLIPGSGISLLAGSILFNLEQVTRGSMWITPALLDLYRSFPVWDYSAANADELARLGLPRPRVVPIGWVPELTRIAPASEDLDVLFYGSINPRRQAVLDELVRRGLRVEAPFVYGQARDRYIARARIVLNIHFYEAKVFEIVRVSYLLANRRVVVSERGCNAAEEAPFEKGIAFADYARLADVCQDLLARPDERRRLAEAGYSVMAARPQSEYLRAALADLA